ncbi:disulfide bond formation protein B [Sphingorhabdus arenilitoris]|uniref:Disulfide bond formation protein B n=1 Tax=Sphingorhabdus arenilitoris TaxID=1490041 RepID=A0ABV8RJ85_9SPHN
MNFRAIRIASLALPLFLLGGAYVSQYIGGLYPCEMCWWQRYPHMAAIPIALLAFFVANPLAQRVSVALAAFAVFTSGVIGGFHAGVEYGWWQGMTGCTSAITGSGEDYMKAILNAPLLRCDVAPWQMFGISLAGYNFLLSCGGAVAILWALWKNPK